MKNQKSPVIYLPDFFDLAVEEVLLEPDDLLFEAPDPLDLDPPLFDLPFPLSAIALAPASIAPATAPPAASFATSTIVSTTELTTLLPDEAVDFLAENDLDADDFEALPPLLDLPEEPDLELEDLLAVDFEPDDLAAAAFDPEPADLLPPDLEAEPEDLDAVVFEPAVLPADVSDVEPEDLAALALPAVFDGEALVADFVPEDLAAGAAFLVSVDAAVLAVDFLLVAVELVALFAGFLVAIIFSFEF